MNREETQLFIGEKNGDIRIVKIEKGTGNMIMTKSVLTGHQTPVTCL